MNAQDSKTYHELQARDNRFWSGVGRLSRIIAEKRRSKDAIERGQATDLELVLLDATSIHIEHPEQMPDAFGPCMCHECQSNC